MSHFAFNLACLRVAISVIGSSLNYCVCLPNSLLSSSLPKCKLFIRTSIVINNFLSCKDSKHVIPNSGSEPFYLNEFPYKHLLICLYLCVCVFHRSHPHLSTIFAKKQGSTDTKLGTTSLSLALLQYEMLGPSHTCLIPKS